MRFSRRTCRWLSGWLIGALLCMQWAVAAYVCPQAAVAGAADGEQMQMAVSGMPGCPGMSAPMPDRAADESTPLLCVMHCTPGSHAFQASHADLSVDLVAPQLITLLDWRPAIELVRSGSLSARHVDMTTGPPTGWPPIYLSLQVLRN